MTSIAGPTRDYRVVQIHPLLKCNLRCRHCYSTSSPDQLRALPLDRILAALSLLRREGFNAVGVSGGEPLLYGELSTVLQHARKLEMITTVTTNAMLLNDQRAEMLHDGANLVAVSLDGPPDSHNHLRAHPRAFELMTQGVARLRRAGVPFGFIFTLSLHNLHELSWVADYAVAQGASLLQVHPLEEVGRATDQLQGSAPDPLELARTFVEVARLQKRYEDRITMQYDVADLEILFAKPERGYAVELPACCELDQAEMPALADLIAPIVIEADGTIVPLQYNFSRSYQLGNIRADCLQGPLDAWKRETFPRFLALCRGVHRKIMEESSPDFPFVNWYSEVLRSSHAATCFPEAACEPIGLRGAAASAHQ